MVAALVSKVTHGLVGVNWNCHCHATVYLPIPLVWSLGAESSKTKVACLLAAGTVTSRTRTFPRTSELAEVAFARTGTTAPAARPVPPRSGNAARPQSSAVVLSWAPARRPPHSVAPEWCHLHECAGPASPAARRHDRTQLRRARRLMVTASGTNVESQRAASD